MALLAELGLIGDFAFLGVMAAGLWIMFLLNIGRVFLNMFGDYGWRLMGFFLITFTQLYAVDSIARTGVLGHQALQILQLMTLILCLPLSGWICWSLGWASDIAEALFFLAVIGVPGSVILGLLHWFLPHVMTWTPMLTTLIVSLCFFTYSRIYERLTYRRG